jgi:predicted nucleic acid-binding Zn ribbon protein
MAEDALDSFIDQKKADSPFLSLLDGESVKVKTLKSLKMVTKIGFSGDEVQCLRLVCVVETEYGDKEKNFDNQSAKFAKQLKANGIVKGSSFTITREGEGPKTVYLVTEAVNPTTDPAVQAAGL